jgi:hypothetical protein
MDGEHRLRSGCGVPGGRGVSPQGEVESAVLVALSGQNPWTFLRTKDPEKRALMLKIAARAAEVRADEREDQAVRTINRLSEAMKTGR